MSVTEEKFPEREYLGLVAGLVLHASSAGLRHFDHAQRHGLTKKLNARLLAHASPEVAAATLNETLKIELLKPVTELLHHAAVEGIDRAELFARAALLGEAVAARLFLDPVH